MRPWTRKSGTFVSSFLMMHCTLPILLALWRNTEMCLTKCSCNRLNCCVRWKIFQPPLTLTYGSTGPLKKLQFGRNLRGVADYHHDAIHCFLPRLPVCYQYLKKGTDSFWLDRVHVKCHALARFRMFAPWHQSEVENVEALHHGKRWIAVSRGFQK